MLAVYPFRVNFVGGGFNSFFSGLYRRRSLADYGGPDDGGRGSIRRERLLAAAHRQDIATCVTWPMWGLDVACWGCNRREQALYISPWSVWGGGGVDVEIEVWWEGGRV